MSEMLSTPSIALKKTIRLFLVGAVVLAAISLSITRFFSEDIMAKAENASVGNLLTLWTSYRHYYIDDGRVIRPKNNNDTVSEGQAYAMLRAVWLADRRTFDEVYRWTEENLSRFKTYGDHLLSWRFGIDNLGVPVIMDPTPAIDADLDYALALFLASRRWPDGRAPANLMPYREKAMAVADNVMAKAVYAHSNGELVLLPWIYEPGNNEEARDRDLTLNPSYFSPGHYRVFEAESGNRRWGKLADDTYRQAARLLEYGGDSPDAVQVVPDWIVMTADGGFATDPTRGYVSSWDAFRFWWRFRLDYDFTGNRAARDLIEGKLVKFLVKSMEKSGGEVASESDRDGNPRVKRANAGMTAVYSWSLRDFVPVMSRTLQRQATRQLQRDGEYMYFQDRDDYYTNSWAWLAMTEGATRFPFEGFYNFGPAQPQTPDAGGRP